MLTERRFGERRGEKRRRGGQRKQSSKLDAVREADEKRERDETGNEFRGRKFFYVTHRCLSLEKVSLFHSMLSSTSFRTRGLCSERDFSHSLTHTQRDAQMYSSVSLPLVS